MAGAGYDDWLLQLVLAVQLSDDEGCLEAVEDGHADVHEDDSETFALGQALLDHGYCLQAVVGSDYVLLQGLETYLLDHHLETEHVEGLVVHYHYFLLEPLRA